PLEAGTPAGVQLPGVFQLPVAPAQVLVGVGWASAGAAPAARTRPASRRGRTSRRIMVPPGCGWLGRPPAGRRRAGGRRSVSRSAARRRRAQPRPSPAAASRANVPGSGTALGVYVRDSVLLAASRLQPNDPPTGLANPAVSNTVAASSA